MATLHSLIRILLATLLALVVLSIATYHGLRWYGGEQRERVTQSYTEHHGSIDPSSFVKSHISDNQNSAFWFIKGGATFRWHNNENHDVARAAVTNYADWTQEVANSVHLAEKRNPEALAAYSYAAILPQSSFAIDYSRGEETNTPSLLYVMRGARLVVALARRDLAQGNFNGAEKHLQSLRVLAESLETEIDITTQYSGWAIESMLLNIIREQLERTEVIGAGALTTLKNHIPTTNLTDSYETYLRWRVASRLSQDHRSRKSIDEVSRPLGFLSASTWQRLVHLMIRDLQAAQQLEALHFELSEYSSFSCGHSAESAPVFDDPVFSDLYRFVNWLRTTRVSRHLTRTAIDITHQGSDIGDSGQSTTDQGEKVSWNIEVDGTIIVKADRSDELSEALCARRYNPPPPLEIRLRLN